MKRRKAVFDYIRRYQHGKFVGWEVCKVLPNTDLPPVIAIAHFYGKRAKTHAKDFAGKLNQEQVE